MGTAILERISFSLCTFGVWERGYLQWMRRSSMSIIVILNSPNTYRIPKKGQKEPLPMCFIREPAHVPPQWSRRSSIDPGPPI